MQHEKHCKALLSAGNQLEKALEHLLPAARNFPADIGLLNDSLCGWAEARREYSEEKKQSEPRMPRSRRAESLGHWDEDPAYSVEDWKAEVANGDTRLGYWGWVRGQHSYNEEQPICS